MVLIIIALQMPSANDPIALSGVLKKEWKSGGVETQPNRCREHKYMKNCFIYSYHLSTLAHFTQD